MQSISLSDVESAVRTIADTSIENEHYFSELDGTCGDGDFGTSLATGFRAILSKWDTLDRSSIGTFLSAIGVIITSKVGGCSGPLWGTGFIRAGALLQGETIDHAERTGSDAPKFDGGHPGARRRKSR
jgi:dihydroxyacetone kinase-like protein